MSETQNRETALKSAINRSVTFPSAFTVNNTSVAFSVAKLKSTGFYKFFITERNGNNFATTSFEILNKQLFLINPGFYSAATKTPKGIKIVNDIIYCTGFFGSLDITIDFFEEFELSLSTAPASITFSSTEKKFDKEVLYYEKDIITSQMTVGENITVETFNTSGQINVERIKFGDWMFSLEGSGTANTISTTCHISHSTPKTNGG